MRERRNEPPDAVARWIVAYDIHDARRRSQLAGLLERRGVRLQQSVFRLDHTHRQIDKLLSEAKRVIDGHRDLVEAWRIHGGRHQERKACGATFDPTPVCVVASRSGIDTISATDQANSDSLDETG